MECRFDTVIYEDKECRALELLKKLNMPSRTYYRQRENGKSAQDAFLYCLNLKQKMTIEQISKEMKVSIKTIRKGFHNEMSLDEIVQAKQEKEAKDLQTIEYLREIGLPLEYNSLTDFCNREQLNMFRIYNRIQKNMNLYEAVESSLSVYEKKSIKYIYVGVSMRAIAQKNALDPNRITFWLRKGYNYLDAIEKEVFARTFSNFKNDGKRFNDSCDFIKVNF